MKKKMVLLTALLILTARPAFTEDLPPLPKGPLLLTSTRPEQLKADYWIKRLPDPDRVLKTPAELKQFNSYIQSMIRECKDIFTLDLSRAGAPIAKQIDLEYSTLKKRILYDAQGKRVPQSIFENEIEPLIQTSKVPARIKMKWGAAVRATSVRALPTMKKMIEAPDDFEFDQLQFTLIKLWTPVGVYYTSTDGQWYYIQAPYVRGWVKAKDIALFATRDELKKYAASSEFMVVTGESIPVYSDAALSSVLRRPTMGTILPLVEQTENAHIVRMPGRKEDGSVSLKKAYVSRKSDVTKGFPAFTQRNIIRQAFKLLGARYGWGGMYNGRDCSGCTHDVYLSMGVAMPRDSKQLAFAGTQLGHFKPGEGTEEKADILSAATPGITLIRMPLHVMIYLGEENGHFYIIHSTWAERISMTSDEKNRINQVVVSDMSLNGKSYLGSLFDRVVSINELS